MKKAAKFIRLSSIVLLLVILEQASTVVGQPQEKTPVILLPGMTASANWACFLFETGCDQPENWGWMPTGQGYYQALIDRLNVAGYTQENGYLTLFLYDWRRPLSENAEKLKASITQVKTATGASQVDLVGHSMGGLVGRAYVQSGDYASDVTHLVTLGSPHQGSAKVYPYWEGASLYQASMTERIALSVLLGYYMIQQYNPFPVLVLRDKVPSSGNLLPTEDYLYDEGNGDQVKPESGMVQRNTFMNSLNSNLNTLFSRAQVTTFAGSNLDTPARLYVHDRDFWQWPNWDDGEPNWGRETEFILPLGDGTVLTSSAQSQTFSGVSHGAPPGDELVIQAIFATLSIPLPAAPSAQPAAAEPAVLVLMLSGGTDGVVTDPLGRTLNKNSSTIPGGEYIDNPNDPFKLITITDPAEGKFTVRVTGTSSGEYEIGLLDTFSSVDLVTDVLSLWDQPHSYIDAGLFTNFALTYTQSAPTATALIASMPVIETPVTFNSQIINGRALPGQWVEIHDAATDQFLGGGWSASDGHFATALFWKTTLGQRIYAKVNGISGVAVPVTGIPLYLPLVKH
jgi:pimeloyl-ACP methyl ester carboxylesterase